LRSGALVRIGGAVACGVALACGGSDRVTGPRHGCDGGLVFTVLPVPLSAISVVTPLGNMGPPTHTIPTDHSGVYLNGTGIPLSAPGPMRVVAVTHVRYLESPFRKGADDYAVTAAVCGGDQVVLGHLQTATARITAAATGSCSTYSTADETVESCRNGAVDISFSAGDELGTVGGPTAPAFDIGLYDPAHRNMFVDPGRFSDLTLTATCAVDAFSDELRSELYAKIGAPGVPASGESPICGTMSVDVPGTARGVWVLESAPVSQSGDETNFAALVPHPLYPRTGLAISIGLPTLAQSAGLAKFPVTVTGRVNREFQDVTGDGQVYCYVADSATGTSSYFVALGADGALTIERLTHPAGDTPCAADPSSWAFDATAVRFIR
jgi:hypothetical protein